MISNFTYLDKDQKYKEIAIACMEAEKSMAVSYSAAALQTRKALEVAVKWAYQYDDELTIPYQDNLSSLIHEPVDLLFFSPISSLCEKNNPRR